MKKLIITIITAIGCIAGSAGFIISTNGVQHQQSPFPEKISAESAIVMDADTGKVLFSKNNSEIRAMASLTKVMSTILTLEAGDLDSTFTVDKDAIHVEGTSMGLQERDIVTRRDLCYGMMLPSGNDAANAAAVSVAGSLYEFIDMMNRKAENIGMEDTNFENPHGLDENGHLSTAYDMALMTKYALKTPGFREICSSESAMVKFGCPPYERYLENNNKMLWSYEGCFGVKTGFTDDAGRCLISAAEQNGTTLIVVTLDAADDWQDHIKMLDYGFEISKYSEITTEETKEETSEIVYGETIQPIETTMPAATNAPARIK